MTDLDELLDETVTRTDQEEPEDFEEEAESEDEVLEQAAAAARRESDEVQQMLARIRSMEQQGRGDESIVAELERRGISRQVALSAWQQHVRDFPEHGHEETPEELVADEQSLEERVGGPGRQGPPGANPLYDLQERVSEASNQELYDTLEQAELYITDRGGVTDEEYEALNTVEQELERRREETDYQSSNDTVESIKSIGRLRMGDEYISSDNQGL